MAKIDELLQELCPEGVEYVELGQVCDIKGRIGFRGYTRNDIVYKGSGAISLSPSNITNGMLYFENSTYISWEKYEESPEIIASEGQIVLTKTGSVGKVALIKYLPEPCTINPQLVLISCTSCNSAFLSYVLQSFSTQNEIKRLASIGTIPNISQRLLGKIIVPLPPLPIQQHIVEVLDTFTDAISNLEEELALREKQFEYYREQLLAFDDDETSLGKKLYQDEFDYVALDSILDYEQPSKYIVKNKQYNYLYSIPVLTAGKSFLLGYTDEVDGIYEASKVKPTIIFDDFTTSFHWVDFPCKVKSSALKFIRPKNNDNVSFRYVYYLSLIHI